MKNKDINIEFINPPQNNVIDDRLEPPLGLMSMGANLIKNGFYNVKINDLCGKNITLDNIGYSDIYGITVYTPTIHNVKEIAALCKIKNKDCKVICGGIHALLMPDELLMDKNIDSVVTGFGEEIIVDIMLDFPNIKRKYHGIITNYDSLPHPNRELVDLNSYSRLLNNKKVANIQTTIGCPFKCNFCLEHKFENNLLSKSPENVLSEISYIKWRYKYDSFIFYDDIFTVNEKRLYKILDLITPLEILFDFHGRANCTKYENYTKIRRAGGYTTRIGIESFSEKMLKLMNKKATVQDNFDAINMSKDSGMLTKIFILFGFPGEDEKTIDETINGIEKSNPDQIFLSTFIPYPGSNVWNNPEKYDIVSFDKNYSNYCFASKNIKGFKTFSTKNLSDEKYFELQEKITNYVYNRNFRGPTSNYYEKLINNFKGVK